MKRWPILVMTILVVGALAFGVIYMISSSTDAEAWMDEKEVIIRNHYPNMNPNNGWFIVRSYEIKDGYYYYDFIWHQKIPGVNYRLWYNQPVDLTTETVYLVQHEQIDVKPE